MAACLRARLPRASSGTDGRRPFCGKKKSQAAHVGALSDALAEFHSASRALADAIDRDAASFESVMAAYKLPQSTRLKSRAAARIHAIQNALARRGESPHGSGAQGRTGI